MYPVSMQGVYKYSRRIRFSEMRAAAETCWIDALANENRKEGKHILFLFTYSLNNIIYLIPIPSSVVIYAEIMI